MGNLPPETFGIIATNKQYGSNTSDLRLSWGIHPFLPCVNILRGVVKELCLLTLNVESKIYSS